MHVSQVYNSLGWRESFEITQVPGPTQFSLTLSIKIPQMDRSHGEKNVNPLSMNVYIFTYIYVFVQAQEFWFFFNLMRHKQKYIYKKDNQNIYANKTSNIFFSHPNKLNILLANSFHLGGLSTHYKQIYFCILTTIFSAPLCKIGIQ